MEDVLPPGDPIKLQGEKIQHALIYAYRQRSTEGENDITTE